MRLFRLLPRFTPEIDEVPQVEAPVALNPVKKLFAPHDVAPPYAPSSPVELFRTSADFTLVFVMLEVAVTAPTVRFPTEDDAVYSFTA